MTRPTDPVHSSEAWTGISIREYLAARAMQGLLAGWIARDEMSRVTLTSLAEDAVTAADLLLVALNRQGTKP